MNKKIKKNASTSGGLSFKRETVRSLTADEVRQVAGGKIKDREPNCPESICNITDVGGENN